MSRLTVCIVLAALLLPNAVAEKHGKGRGRGHKEEAVRTFAGGDRAVIVRELPPGLAKRDRLPPGLEKHLRRNGALPPGLERKLVPFPAAVEMRLPPCPPDVRRGFVGGFAVMYNSRTGLILDAFAIGGR